MRQGPKSARQAPPPPPLQASAQPHPGRAPCPAASPAVQLTPISIGFDSNPMLRGPARSGPRCPGSGHRAELGRNGRVVVKPEEMMRQATRIRDRAIRRCGELLKQIEPGQGARDGKREVGDHPPLRKEAATSAGLSPHQAKQAIRVDNVPEAASFSRSIGVTVKLPPRVARLARCAPPCQGWTLALRSGSICPKHAAGRGQP